MVILNRKHWLKVTENVWIVYGCLSTAKDDRRWLGMLKYGLGWVPKTRFTRDILYGWRTLGITNSPGATTLYGCLHQVVTWTKWREHSKVSSFKIFCRTISCSQICSPYVRIHCSREFCRILFWGVVKFSISIIMFIWFVVILDTRMTVMKMTTWILLTSHHTKPQALS